ncbi:MAG TPA: hypothetical protein VM431_09540 [Phycisphaerae bacterium]|nr:hypothetical protein [Phycisphaerae bacterium]
MTPPSLGRRILLAPAMVLVCCCAGTGGAEEFQSAWPTDTVRPWAGPEY